jgi:hypothetical protein
MRAMPALLLEPDRRRCFPGRGNGEGCRATGALQLVLAEEAAYLDTPGVVRP